MHSWIKAISGAIVAQRGPGRSANTVGVTFTLHCSALYKHTQSDIVLTVYMNASTDCNYNILRVFMIIDYLHQQLIPMVIRIFF